MFRNKLVFFSLVGLVFTWLLMLTGCDALLALLLPLTGHPLGAPHAIVIIQNCPPSAEAFAPGDELELELEVIGGGEPPIYIDGDGPLFEWAITSDVSLVKWPEDFTETDDNPIEVELTEAGTFLILVDVVNAKEGTYGHAECIVTVLETDEDTQEAEQLQNSEGL